MLDEKKNTFSVSNALEPALNQFLICIFLSKGNAINDKDIASYVIFDSHSMNHEFS